MADGARDERTDRWFDPLLRGLPAPVRYRLFGPAYEDLRHDQLLRLRGTRWRVWRVVLRAWFALRVIGLIGACYRGTPEFVFVHPFRAAGAALRAIATSNRTMLTHDVRQAFRTFRNRPVFNGIAVAILALGIGSSTAIFSVVDAVLLKPLPFPDAGRLVSLEETSNGRRSGVSPVNYLDWRAQAKSFRGLAIYAEQTMTLTAGDRAEAVDGFSVSASFFPLLGVKPALGRWFATEDDRSPGPSSVVLSHGLWQRAFGGARDAVGRQAIFDGRPFTVIGVAPAGAEFPEKTEAWFSLALSARNVDPASRGAHYVSALGRLRPGVTLATASAEMQTISAQLAAAYPRTNRGSGVAVEDLVTATVGPAVRSGILLVLGAVGFLLLIACVNVSGLMIVRAATRRVELAVRAALGAGRPALIRQVMVESLVLAGVAALVGTLLAAWTTRALLAVLPAGVPRASASGVDLRVLGFTAVVTVCSALLFGSLPAFQSMTTSLGESLRESRRDSGGAANRRVRDTLVTVEVALAVVLLVGAALAVRSFERLTRVSPGFDARGILTFTLSLPDGIYKEDRQVAVFYADLVDRLAHVPGAVSSAAVMMAPVSTSGFGGSFSIEGRADSSGPDEPRAQMRPITPGYFRTLGLPLVRGRAFDERDGADAPPVAIISNAAAQRFWPGEDPIGRRIRMHVSAIGGRQTFREIVGIVRDVKNARLDQPAAPMVYLPHAQHPASVMAVMVRTAGDPAAAQGTVADAVRQADKTLVPLQMEPMESRVAASRGDQRFRAVLLGMFAGSAFILAIVGLYAVVSFATHVRRHEIGVRVALGARAGDIVGMVLRDGMRPVLVGLTLGSVGSAALSGLMRTLVFGVRPFEPTIVAGVVAGFALAAIAACLVPARRAPASDPTRALRQE